MDRLEQSQALIEMVTDELITGVCCTWRVPDAAAAKLRAEIVAALTRAVVDAPLLVPPIEGDGER